VAPSTASKCARDSLASPRQEPPPVAPLPGTQLPRKPPFYRAIQVLTLIEEEKKEASPSSDKKKAKAARKSEQKAKRNRREFEDGNRDYCNVCKNGGDLLCCDHCPRAFHLACIGQTADELPPGEWHCERCK